MSSRIAHALLAFSAFALTACGGSHPAPTSPSPPSNGGNAPGVRVDVKIDDLGSPDAVVSLSNVTVDASSSTGAAGLTFSIDFGDGTVAAGQTARHIYATPGAFTIAVTAKDDQGRTASDSRQISVKSVTGRWFEAEYVRSSRRVEVRRLTVTSQDGLTIGGLYQIDGGPDRSFTGTLGSPRNVRIALDGGAALEGSLPWRLNDEAEQWSLQAQGDTVDGERLEFRFIPGDPTDAGPDANVKLSFDGGPGMPIVGLTPVTIDATSSRGTGLLFFLEFGDGFVATNARDTHVVDVPDPPPLSGRLEARVTAVDRFGRSNSDSENYAFFELGVHQHGQIAYEYWSAVDLERHTSLRINFFQRQGATYIGEAEQSQTFVTPARATLSASGDIVITLPAVGIEYRGRIERLTESYITMPVVQHGGRDDGRKWELYLTSTY